MVECPSFSKTELFKASECRTFVRLMDLTFWKFFCFEMNVEIMCADFSPFREERRILKFQI